MDEFDPFGHFAGVLVEEYEGPPLMSGALRAGWGRGRGLVGNNGSQESFFVRSKATPPPVTPTRSSRRMIDRPTRYTR